jgi:branched-chain amino acid transport system ATP-binding protein
MLEIRDVTVRFGGVRPLVEVTLTFPPGISGLVGPNGAGKTTMLNVLSGFVRPATGSLWFDGQALDRLSPHRRARSGLRRTFQAEQVVLSLSARDNVRLAAENLGAPTSDVDRVLQAVGLESPDRPGWRLSMLERRLVEIARALVGTPRLVLLDEPGAGLAEADARTLVPLIHRLAEADGTVVVLVDHDMDLVQTVCSELAVLDFGRLIAHGPTADVLADPVVARAYLGTEELA